ncbi:myb-binding protein 1A-like [Teleopsis dalmanni]|uniref:myb-binding protein 1A-like n=1 Tax=Teleopsis dalmanni TaxID=139649 RepID=UPI0018CF1DAB|nr:myb-binding protein 1A-like [Teleopsis dalmanni]
MYLSANKRVLKRQNPAGGKKTVKKRKLANSEPEYNNHHFAPSLKLSIDTRIFLYFNELVNEDSNIRVNAALSLMQHLSKKTEVEKRQKELYYTLKRLVRGCGASTNISRAGFFTALVLFLKKFLTEISNKEVFDALQNELRTGTTIVKKNDSDAVVGKILVCVAIMHSGRVFVSSEDDLQKLTLFLLRATKHRTYHSSLGYGFLIEFLNMISEEQFEVTIWPYLTKDIIKPWTKQTMQTIHCLICVHKIFPEVVNEKILESNFGGSELLNTESFQYIYKIFWENCNTNNLTDPVYDDFGSYIATQSKLNEFWTEYVDKGLNRTTKFKEIVTLRIVTAILKSLDITKTKIEDLMSENFMILLIKGLKDAKYKKDETLLAFYKDYFEALLIGCEKVSDKQKVAVIKRLIEPPGTFNIEKFTHTRIINQLVNSLGEAGVKEIFEIFKRIFLGLFFKSGKSSYEELFHFERSIAGYMLQHLLSHISVRSSFKWREEQLRFLLTGGIFHVTNEMEICKIEDSGSFSKNFGYQCLKMFYSSLNYKSNVMKKEKKLLLNLVNYCNEVIQRKNSDNYLRIKNIDQCLQKSWSYLYNAVLTETNKCKPSEANNRTELQMIFHILLLNMGLQYFKEPEMARLAIEDIIVCMHRLQGQQKFRIVTKSNKENEPNWIEVVIDLFLHLLSQNTSALRNIVNQLFPFFCDKLTLNAIHQILSMLDMKDGQNPLSLKDEDIEDVEEEDSDRTKSDNELDSNNDDTASESYGQSEIDESEDMGTGVDKLRNAISMALIETEAGGVDDDMESVDLNELSEEQGRKLDEALANAFKIKKSTSKTPSKKSKSYQVRNITVMHFRIRVLDLIEIYIQQKPLLCVSIEIMLALFNMMEYCIAEELKPLRTKVEKVLNKLTSLKSFAIELELNQHNIVDFIRLIIERRTQTSAFDIISKIRNKCVIFLINNACKVMDNNSLALLNLCNSYIEEFIKSRNAYINATLLSDIFRLRLIMVWELAQTLAELGFSLKTRVFRRIQTYEILSVLYKNCSIQNCDIESAKNYFWQIDKLLIDHIKTLATTKNMKYSLNEYQKLLEFLLLANKTYTRLQLNNTSLASFETINFVQDIRRQIYLVSLHTYQRYCTTHKIKVIRNNELKQLM